MWTEIPSPIGALRLVATAGAITAIDFVGEVTGDPSGAEADSVRRHSDRADGRPRGRREDDDPVLREAARQLGEYFAGERRSFDLPLTPVGTEFQQRVWAQLVEIDYGSTASYGEIAVRLGMTGHGARAVGLANGRNPIPVVVPCHRVVGADGRLTGYAGGTARKQVLLSLEQHALF